MVTVMETLTFAHVYQYDTRQAGITVPVILRAGSESVDCDAKVDAGSSCCVFRRLHAEYLELNVEGGVPQMMQTVMGSFLTYGHDVTLSVLGIETATTVYFAADESFTRNVLGRQGWPNVVRLGLVDYEGKLYLSHYNDPG
jgi:hypothetical protein